MSGDDAIRGGRMALLDRRANVKRQRQVIRKTNIDAQLCRHSWVRCVVVVSWWLGAFSDGRKGWGEKVEVSGHSLSKEVPVDSLPTLRSVITHRRRGVCRPAHASHGGKEEQGAESMGNSSEHTPTPPIPDHQNASMPAFNQILTLKGSLSDF